MKTKSLLSVILIFGIALCSACKKKDIVPSETITSREYDISGYNQLDVQDAFKVTVHFTDEDENVRVEANDNLHQYISVEKNLMVLSINLDDNINLENNPATLNVYVNADYIYSFKGSGASSFNLLDPLGGNVNEINLSGASYFTGPLNGKEVNAQISGASTLNIEGESEKFNLNLSGASTMEGYAFATDWLNGNFSGASNASLTVNNKIDIEATGASTLYYKGDGIINSQNLTGGSQIFKMD